MGSRIPSHQLSNGLVVSGPPEYLKERQPTMGSRAVPYTGGDVKKSGELGKMFDIQIGDHLPGPPPPLKPSRHSSSSQQNSGSVRSGSNSGQISKKSSGPMTPQLQPTGLITSGPLGSGSQGSGPRRSSGQLEQTASMSNKVVYGSAVTALTDDVKVNFRVSKAVVWVFMVAVAMGLLVGGFLMVAVKKWVILMAVVLVLVPVGVVVVWNYVWGKRGLLGFVRSYPDAELRGAVDGQFVKVTGVVTCGSIPLESSYQRVPRCVYVSTELCEAQGCGSKSTNKKANHSEKYVADFYISDFQSGLRALVKAGYGAKVAPFVKPATVVDVTKENRDMSPSFLRWLAERNLSTDDRIMRLKEGYIKEGSTVSVMGVVRRHDNVVMIVPPVQPVSTGFQWLRCLLPTYVEGLILTCDDTQDADVVPV
ncbi:PREDICTED: uncharacterized membrane protein At1g16860 [Fragaria vesca subsp. vesca]|uniref:uncharacterized membrane protein At1g16860 n=1 Tax=Fragaria vesca subsp. vesca TaxID=101020 RepID=UPI0002C33795|nr:PREDICTED: uncharacterized membrane protein At1g16860 [Fragaria vesca subsp. vesca]